MCRNEGDMQKLLDQIRPGDVSQFEYISLHLLHVIPYDNVEKAKDVLKIVQRLQDKFNFKAVVIHPDEVENWNVFLGFSLPILIENMDWRKEIGKYTDSLKDIFSKFDVPMVLDLNHCYTNDPSMRLAQEISETFKNRIAEIHLSGFEYRHEPLFKTKQLEILEAIPDKNLPIIIESGCETIEELKKEYAYVRTFLEKGLKMPILRRKKVII
jgi:hypothetical protein